MRIATLASASFLFLVLPFFTHGQERECTLNPGDSAAQLFAKVGEAVSGQGGSAGGTYVELLAGSDSGRVFLRTGTTLSRGAEPGTDIGASRFDTWRVQISAPTSKSDSFSEIASLDGLSNSFELGASWSRFTAQRRNPFVSGVIPADINCLCARAKEAAVARGVPLATIEETEANGGCSEVIGRLAPELLDQWDAQFWESRFTPYYGISARVGHEEFEYFDSVSFEKEEVDQQPWSIRGSWGFLPSNRSIFVLFGIEYQESFKAADTVTRCPLLGDDFLACETGAFDRPGRTEKLLVSALVRGTFWQGRVGLSPQITYDMESEVLAADLPIYFARDSKKNLVGGVRLGWNDDVDDVKFGVFVSSKAFGLF